ncbi:MAG TPA: hypothetical protein VM658_08720 [bacterium]|nr:hypothetical protein [bacterium]
MANLHERFLVDEQGKRVGVVLEMKAYRKVLSALEELESIRAYDAAKLSGDASLPFARAVAEIERRKKSK